MGVPAFFRWLSKKYPSIVVHCVEEKAREVNGVKAPVDTSLPNPNDYEFDNLYLDMNGIIHPCCHPENKPAPQNEDEMMVAIFEYIDRIFSIVRPRKLLYMAIDGVAPRAKMNQQRSRRFRASKESREKAEEIAKIRSELKERGAALPPEKEKTEHFDSNCITPGTEFMANLSLCLRYYIADRLNNDPGWKNIKVVLSDANVPGEGEHKIMDYIRKQRANPNHDPNTKHCLNGADADLIMLGLATHELHFTILREEFKPNQKKPCEICGQIGHAMDECMGLPKEKQGEFDELPAPVAQDVEFIFIRLNVLREYLERELRMEGLPFPYSFERCLDDWVFMCFFVGNDFLPHLPSLEIREGAIDRLVGIYKRVLPRCGGYLAKHGIVDLSRVEMVLQELGYVEDEIFKKRQQNDLAYKRRLKENKAREKLKRQRMDGPLWTPSGQFSPSVITNSPSPIVNPRQEAYAMRKQGMSYSADRTTPQNEANKSAAASLKAILTTCTPSPDPSMSSAASTPNSVSSTGKRKQNDDDDEEEPKDDIRLWEAGWKGRYYQNKFQLSENDAGYDDFRKKVADAYVEGLCWVLLYYYQGCPSWKWFYPYHYAPFASDFRDIDSLRNSFESGTQPDDDDESSWVGVDTLTDDDLSGPKPQEIISLEDDDENSWVGSTLPDDNSSGPKPQDITVRRDEDVLWVLSINCCQKRCMRKLSVDDIQHAEVQFNERRQTCKRNFVLEFLHNHSHVNDIGEYETEFFIRGKSVCKGAWLLSHNMNKETFRRILNKFKDGVLVLEHGNKGKNTVMAKTAECISWLQFFVNSIGDHQPDKGCIHLPSCFSRSDIYRKMLEENTALNLPTVCLSHFYNIWEKHFAHVLIPKENRFTKCTDCTKYKQEKERTMDKARRAEIDRLLKLHLELVWQERRAYYLHRYKARKYPERYMASIADGMDQHTTNIPKLRRISKAMSALTTVGTHLVGSIVHSGQSSHGKEVYGSFDYYQFPHDANLTMTVLLDVLVYWTNKYLLPPVLYLQFDNCVRENKNRYMFALLALLVEEKIFEKIRVNFLPVGHTHEDIDAFFGVFSKFLDKCDVYVIEDLLRALSSCMSNPSPKPYKLQVVYDIRSWVEEYAEELHAHTVPKCFKFKRNEAGKAEMFYRNWSHEEWQGPVIILKSLPIGKPKLVTPSLVKLDIEALRRDIPRYHQNMPKEAADEWEGWFSHLDELTCVPDSYCWPIDKLRQSARTAPAPPAAQISPDLLELRDRETRQIQEFKPLEQLMGVFPAASGKFLPPTWRELMSNPESPIIDFYPQDFAIDLNGKKYAWQGVALLPFVDEKRLLSALSKVYADLTKSEKTRNSRGKDRLFLRQGNPVFDFLVGLYEGGAAEEPVDIVADLSGGMSGKVQPDDVPILPRKTVVSPLPNLYDLKDNRSISVLFGDPVYEEGHIYKAEILPKAQFPARVLKPEGYDQKTPYRPVIGMNANRTSFAQIGDAGRRMLNFQRGDIFRPQTPGNFVPPFRSFTSPPPNNPRHGYPTHPRSNPSTPLSSRDYNDARRQTYDRRAPQHNYSGGYQGAPSQYNSGGFQRNGPSAQSRSAQFSRGPGSSQSQFSRNVYQNSSRDQWQQPNRQGPPERDSRRHSYPLSNYRYRPY